MTGIIGWVVVGVIAGWLAGLLVKGGGFGLIGDLVIGVLGAFVGGWLAGVLGIHIGTGMLGSLVTATVGAILLVVIFRMITRSRT